MDSTVLLIYGWPCVLNCNSTGIVSLEFWRQQEVGFHLSSKQSCPRLSRSFFFLESGCICESCGKLFQSDSCLKKPLREQHSCDLIFMFFAESTYNHHIALQFSEGPASPCRVKVFCVANLFLFDHSLCSSFLRVGSITRELSSSCGDCFY